jgi:selenide,water dikinase
VLFALNVAGFPRDFPREVISQIFSGGADKVAEGGGVVAGGHTVVDAEPKYGLCVTGRVHPAKILIKGGLGAGHRLFLSKPLGTGVITTAAKEDACGPDVLAGAVKSMLRLNRVAAEVLQDLDVRGATDITGFGLLGHGAEMVEASGVGLLIHAAKLPLLDGALALAEKGLLSGGMKRNRRYLESTLGAKGQLVIDTAISPGLVSLLFEAETSGGLLFSVPQERADRVAESFKKRGEACWEIGEVTKEPAIRVA